MPPTLKNIIHQVSTKDTHLHKSYRWFYLPADRHQNFLATCLSWATNLSKGGNDVATCQSSVRNPGASHKVQPLKLLVRHFLILPLLIQARNRRQTLPSMSFPNPQTFLGNKVSCQFHRDWRQWSLQQLLGPFFLFHPIWPILFIARHYNQQSLQVSRWGAKGRWVHY